MVLCDSARTTPMPTLAQLAEGLDADDVPTAHGGMKWHPATVRKVLLSQGF